MELLSAILRVCCEGEVRHWHNAGESSPSPDLRVADVETIFFVGAAIEFQRRIAHPYTGREERHGGRQAPVRVPCYRAGCLMVSAGTQTFVNLTLSERGDYHYQRRIKGIGSAPMS